VTDNLGAWSGEQITVDDDDELLFVDALIFFAFARPSLFPAFLFFEDLGSGRTRSSSSFLTAAASLAAFTRFEDLVPLSIEVGVRGSME